MLTNFSRIRWRALLRGKRYRSYPLAAPSPHRVVSAIATLSYPFSWRCPRSRRAAKQADGEWRKYIGKCPIEYLPRGFPKRNVCKITTDSLVSYFTDIDVRSEFSENGHSETSRMLFMRNLSRLTGYASWRRPTRRDAAVRRTSASLIVSKLSLAIPH